MSITPRVQAAASKPCAPPRRARAAEGDGDLRATIARFGRALGLTRLGVNQEIVPPGRRTSTPHAHSLGEEFVFVVEAKQDLWIDGELHTLRPGDGVAFAAGTGLGENIPGDRAIAPEARRPEDDWSDAPPLGDRNGRAERLPPPERKL